MSVSQTTQDTEPERPKPWRVYMRDALSTDDPSILQHAFDLGVTAKPSPDLTSLEETLRRAVTSNKLRVAQYLIETAKVSLDGVYPEALYRSESMDMYNLLIDYGWDINKHEPDRGNGIGSCLIQLVCDDDQRMDWCLDHGADPSRIKVELPGSPPLLELVAHRGTLKQFKRLLDLDRDATSGSRALHKAVDLAHQRENEQYKIAEYLVDSLRYDVNALDTPRTNPLVNHYGTPLCYAARWSSGRSDIARFLLNHGADPSIKDCWDRDNAISIAELHKNQDLIDMFAKWVKDRENK